MTHRAPTSLLKAFSGLDSARLGTLAVTLNTAFTATPSFSLTSSIERIIIIIA